VIYLNSFEKMFEDLYQTDISRLRLAIENVFDTMPMAQSVSKYAFDKQSTTKVLLTCLNQTVISSVNYLTDDLTVALWSQNKSMLLEKFVQCIGLKEHVFNCYNKLIKKINAENREPFQILFITSFGNFAEFVNRLDKVSTLITNTYSNKYLRIST